MNVKKYFSIPLIVIFSLLIVSSIKPAQGPSQGGGVGGLSEEEILKSRIQELQIQLDETKTKETEEKEKLKKQFEAEQTKRKQQKKDFQARSGQTFNTQNAAPAAGTETDQAQAKYWKQQAHHLELKDRYQTPMVIWRATYSDFVVPAMQPEALALRQKLHKTAHEKHLEKMDELNEEHTELSNTNHRATKINTLLSNVSTYCNPNMIAKFNADGTRTPESLRCQEWIKQLGDDVDAQIKESREYEKEKQSKKSS